MNKLVLPICLVLDDISRSKLNVSSSLSELLQYDVRIIRSLRDLTPELRVRKIVLLEDYMRRSNCFSDLELYKEVFNLEYIFIGQDSVLLEAMKDIADCHCMDPTIISYDQLYGIYYKDPAVSEKFISEPDFSDVSKFANQLLEESEVDDKVKRLASSFLAMEDIQQKSSERIKGLKQTLQSISLELQKSSSQSNIIREHYLDLIGKAVQLNNSLRQYEVILSKDIYDKIDITRYNTRPNLVYLKEYEELHNLELLLETLVNMFKLHHKLSVKVLMLLDSSHTKRIMTLPGRYVPLQNKYYKRTLLENDFIVKVGSYKEVMEHFLLNETNLDVLIVVDCKNHLDTVLSGLFLMLPMCRRPRNLEVFNLDPKATIVNNDPGNRLSWDDYPELLELETQEEKFLFLSSRPLIQDIYRSCMSFS